MLYHIEEDNSFYLDCVYVIDATEDMKPYVDAIKSMLLQDPIHRQLVKIINELHSDITVKVRVKVIWFRDFYFDGKYAYGESRFFELPQEDKSLCNFIREIYAAGGGDEPECALEALTLAMRSDFTQCGRSRRHIIVLFTNAEAHALEDYNHLVKEAAKKGCKPEMYPENMPKDLSELYKEWERLDPCGRRLVLFAPNAYPWNEMEIELEFTFRVMMDLADLKNNSEFIGLFSEGFLFD